MSIADDSFFNELWLNLGERVQGVNAFTPEDMRKM